MGVERHALNGMLTIEMACKVVHVRMRSESKCFARATWQLAHLLRGEHHCCAGARQGNVVRRPCSAAPLGATCLALLQSIEYCRIG